MTVVAADIMLISSEVVGIATRQTRVVVGAQRRHRRHVILLAPHPCLLYTSPSPFDCQEPAPRAAVRTYAWR